MRLKIDWASLIVGSKFTVFALFYFVFEGHFPSTSPWGAYIWKGDLTEGFLRYRFGGLIFGGAYTWRGLYMEGIIFGILRYFIVPLRGGFSFAGGSCEKSRASGKRTKGGIALGMRHTFLRRGRLKKARFSRRSLFSPFGIKSWFAGYSRVILHISCHFISVKRFSSYCWLWRSYQSTHR